ncbi:MAG: hypothetical protein NC930_02530 [Candidatus Omnitrophica bacterium]|nr:hypothetical protein [Candidatus Omnitrophota bacterium]
MAVDGEDGYEERIMRYFLQYFLPGLFLILLAFLAGLQRNPFLGLLGFLPFFVIGMTLLIEGLRKKKS